MTRAPDHAGAGRGLRALRERLRLLATSTDSTPGWLTGMSLADKCQYLFGAAILTILLAALVVPWVRMGAVVDASQFETSRQLALLWETTGLTAGGASPVATGAGSEAALDARIRYIAAAELASAAQEDEFLSRAMARFVPAKASRRAASEHHDARWVGATRVYRHAEAVRSGPDGALEGVVFVERRSPQAADLLLRNRGWVMLAGLGAGALAIVVFHLITTRIVLSPVRKLRRTAEAVREGDLTIRSGIRTGDEFEELSEAFNSMLASIGGAHDQLRSSNRSLDLRLHELAESNVALHEANRVKGEFLANVSHELRTPLNSIIGFAELLQAILQQDATLAGITDERRAQIAKRGRYLDNIVSAGRNLLEMINELLEMARIEAGRLEIRPEPMDVGAACDGLLALIRPLAQRKNIELTLEAPGQSPRPADAHRPDPRETFAEALTSALAHPEAEDAERLPVITTDPRKFQQIIFNFLSNAVKFTPEGGRVTLRAERLRGTDGEERVRVSVLDTGPGIAEEHHKTIFEQFRQLDASHTRTTTGTGLGLAIAKELAAALQSEIQLVSAPGAGAMFSLIVPVAYDPDRARHTPATGARSAPARPVSA